MNLASRPRRLCVGAVTACLLATIAPAATAARRDKTPPTAPTALTATGATREIDLRWDASTDNVGVVEYRVYRGGVQIATTSANTLTYADVAAAPGTVYSYTVRAADAVRNLSAPSNAAQAIASDTPPGDAQAPTVQVSYPTAGATLEGIVTLTASAQDNVGVTQAKWYVDGTEVGWDGAAPWAQAWNSATVSDGAHTLFAKAADAAGNWGTSAPVSVTVANAQPPTGSTVIAAVGDITYGSNSQSVERKIAAANPAAVLMTGDYDNARSPASLSDILADVDPFYGPKPGGLYPIMYPTAGPTHDVSSCTTWGGYQQYWGKDPTKPYSFDVGGWHVLSIPEIVARYNCGIQAITDWINADLTAHNNQCTIAYWHEPYFTSATTGHGPQDATLPWVQALYNHGVDILVSGHQNSDFEAFYPQTPQRTRDDAHGIQAFVAATGGQSGYTYTNTAANSITKASGVYGPIILTLRSGSYDWKFDQAVGSGYSPSGSNSCR